MSDIGVSEYVILNEVLPSHDSPENKGNPDLELPVVPGHAVLFKGSEFAASNVSIPSSTQQERANNSESLSEKEQETMSALAASIAQTKVTGCSNASAPAIQSGTAKQGIDSHPTRIAEQDQGSLGDWRTEEQSDEQSYTSILWQADIDRHVQHLDAVRAAFQNLDIEMRNWKMGRRTESNIMPPAVGVCINTFFRHCDSYRQTISISDIDAPGPLKDLDLAERTDQPLFQRERSETAPGTIDTSHMEGDWKNEYLQVVEEIEEIEQQEEEVRVELHQLQFQGEDETDPDVTSEREALNRRQQELQHQHGLAVLRYQNLYALELSADEADSDYFTAPSRQQHSEYELVPLRSGPRVEEVSASGWKVYSDTRSEPVGASTMSRYDMEPSDAQNILREGASVSDLRRRKRELFDDMEFCDMLIKDKRHEYEQIKSEEDKRKKAKYPMPEEDVRFLETYDQKMISLRKKWETDKRAVEQIDEQLMAWQNQTP
ncbi:hypothetical protein A1O1_05078 [Capronia coronata CBS 617.96]|uniref:Uncharacterized protein n=1 Tax=Capronia coronata CBS 617.96 TaxID=1182541 RepID=W9YEQ0_9EURO|nr:uncharacterized protein A1O1_05078 [Capronia coronata CBS 617.96]EXJ88150.1 hypothetical protein A1O1_05078 [Capronia coronata CBS 617.96]